MDNITVVMDLIAKFGVIPLLLIIIYKLYGEWGNLVKEIKEKNQEILELEKRKSEEQLQLEKDKNVEIRKIERESIGLLYKTIATLKKLGIKLKRDDEE